MSCVKKIDVDNEIIIFRSEIAFITNETDLTIYTIYINKLKTYNTNVCTLNAYIVKINCNCKNCQDFYAELSCLMNKMLITNYSKFN